MYTLLVMLAKTPELPAKSIGTEKAAAFFIKPGVMDKINAN